MYHLACSKFWVRKKIIKMKGHLLRPPRLHLLNPKYNTKYSYYHCWKQLFSRIFWWIESSKENWFEIEIFYIINSGRPIHRQCRSIGRYLLFIKYRHQPISFSVWPMCSWQDFYFDDAENGSAWAHSAHILSLVRCRCSILSNMDRSLSNNQNC